MKTYIHHIRLFGDDKMLTRGGATVAIEPLEDGSAKVATAYCSLDDNYNKKRGKTIATGRLSQNKCFYMALSEVDDMLALALKLDPSSTARNWKNAMNQKRRYPRPLSMRRRFGKHLQGIVVDETKVK